MTFLLEPKSFSLIATSRNTEPLPHPGRGFAIARAHHYFVNTDKYTKPVCSKRSILWARLSNYHEVTKQKPWIHFKSA